jgi:hypothetical protein
LLKKKKLKSFCSTSIALDDDDKGKKMSVLLTTSEKINNAKAKRMIAQKDIASKIAKAKEARSRIQERAKIAAANSKDIPAAIPKSEDICGIQVEPQPTPAPSSTSPSVPIENPTLHFEVTPASSEPPSVPSDTPAILTKEIETTTISIAKAWKNVELEDTITTSISQAQSDDMYGVHFYWINLDRATERRQRMIKQLEERRIKNTRIQAFDGLVNGILNPYVPSNWNQAAFQHHKSEIATTISHIRAIYQFVLSGEPHGLIMEDDAIFEYEPKWPCTLKTVILGAPSGWETISLSLTLSDAREWDGIMNMGKCNRYLLRKWNWFSAVAYLITRDHAISILKRYNCDHTKPEFKCKLNGAVNHMQSEMNIIGTGPRRYLFYPPMFTYPTDNNSFIHPQHLRTHQYAKQLISKAYL